MDSRLVWSIDDINSQQLWISLIIYICSTIQCTMAQRPLIKEIKIECPKENSYCEAIFDPIIFNPLLDDAKWPKFCAKYFSLSKNSNIGCFLFVCLWIIVKGWMDNYEIHTMYVSCHVQKKSRKRYPGSPLLCILHSKYQNICHLSVVWDIWNWFFLWKFNSSQKAAKISATLSLPITRWLTQIFERKRNWQNILLKYFQSENGSRGAKSLIPKFLRACAIVQCEANMAKKR